MRKKPPEIKFLRLLRRQLSALNCFLDIEPQGDRVIRKFLTTNLTQWILLVTVTANLRGEPTNDTARSSA